MYPANKRADRGEGYVYLIRPVLGKNSKWFNDEEVCQFKIGVSKSKDGVKSRLKSLSTGNWRKLCIESISPKLLEPYNVEYVLHTKLYKRKIRGEWFEMTLSECKHLKKMLFEETRYDLNVSWLFGDTLTDMAYEYDVMDYLNSGKD